MASVLPTSDRLPKRISLGKIGSGFLFFLVLGLFITNALLIKQNRDLKALIARGQPGFLKQGEQVPTLAANNLSGQRSTVDYAARAKTVLFVFSPQCAACERTAPWWKQIIAASIRNEYQIFGISLGDGLKTNSFLTSNGLRLETLVDIDAETRAAYKFSMTPLTIVIDSKGNVERIWPGAFNQQGKQEVEKYFGISLDDVK
jgi:peroxiredoxin